MLRLKPEEWASWAEARTVAQIRGTLAGERCEEMATGEVMETGLVRLFVWPLGEVFPYVMEVAFGRHAYSLTILSIAQPHLTRKPAHIFYGKAYIERAPGAASA